MIRNCLKLLPREHPEEGWDVCDSEMLGNQYPESILRKVVMRDSELLGNPYPESILREVDIHVIRKCLETMLSRPAASLEMLIGDACAGRRQPAPMLSKVRRRQPACL